MNETESNLRITRDRLHETQVRLDEGKDNEAAIGPRSSNDWLEYATICAQSVYTRRRFIDLDVVNTGRGLYEINEGLQATKAFHAASLFDTI